jgi:hypothetical protein
VAVAMVVERKLQKVVQPILAVAVAALEILLLELEQMVALES